MSIINILKNILAPKKCYSCKKEGHFLCYACSEKLDNFSEICYFCKNPSPNFELHKDCKENSSLDKIIVFTHYKNTVIKKLIADAKFYGKKDILEDFGNYLTKMLRKYEKNVKKEEVIILPVPMYFLRRWKRGYNQSEVLSKHISENLDIPYFSNILSRTRHTQQQSKISKKLRANNLENAFNINKKYIKNLQDKHIILVDDVVSTGATLEEIAKLLKYNGVITITCLIIASD